VKLCPTVLETGCINCCFSYLNWLKGGFFCILEHMQKTTPYQQGVQLRQKCATCDGVAIAYCVPKEKTAQRLSLLADLSTQAYLCYSLL
jgi:hypothetical protein